MRSLSLVNPSRWNQPPLAAVGVLAALVWLAGMPASAWADAPDRVAARFASHGEDGDDHDHEEDDHDDHDHEDGGDDYDDEEENLEIELAYVEMERASIETIFGGLELVEKVARIAADDDAIAALAINSVPDVMEPEDAADFLKEVVADAPSKTIRRIARLKLAELYGEMDRPRAVRGQLSKLIYGED